MVADMAGQSSEVITRAPPPPGKNDIPRTKVQSRTASFLTWERSSRKRSTRNDPNNSLVNITFIPWRL
jgi:hypothetical protein